jgi:Tfp pilus assembly protein PilX
MLITILVILVILALLGMRPGVTRARGAMARAVAWA